MLGNAYIGEPHRQRHLDAPSSQDCRWSCNRFAATAKSFTGSAYIADLRPLEPKSWITPEMLAAALPDPLPQDAIVLMSTGWGDIRERSDVWLYGSPKLHPETAHWLVQRGTRGLGVDHWGIGGWDKENDAAVHTILLGSGIWIVEELKFPQEVYIMPTPLQFMALPINLKGHSGAWCRPVLLI